MTQVWCEFSHDIQVCANFSNAQFNLKTIKERGGKREEKTARCSICILEQRLKKARISWSTLPLAGKRRDAKRKVRKQSLAGYESWVVSSSGYRLALNVWLSCSTILYYRCFSASRHIRNSGCQTPRQPPWHYYVFRTWNGPLIYSMTSGENQ